MDHLTTEQNNPESVSIDQMDPIQIAMLMNREDLKVVAAVERVLPDIARAIEIVTERVQAGGRLIYIGAGTSGRLGVLDASECPPTFNTPPALVVGLIAGGHRALTNAIEGAEDNRQAGEEDLRGIDVDAKDVVCGIATSGRTPYVLGGLAYARSLGAATLGVTCNAVSELSEVSDVLIAPVVERIDEAQSGYSHEDGFEHDLDRYDDPNRQDLWQLDGRFASDERETQGSEYSHRQRDHWIGSRASRVSFGAMRWRG